MTESPLDAAQRLFARAVDALRGVAEAGSVGERMSVLTACEAVVRQLDQVTVATVAGLDREGVFVDKGYKSATQALADLVGWEGREARRRTVAAEQVTPRTRLDGSVLPARPSATAEVFAAGRAGLRHVEVIARVLGSKAAERLSPEQWAGVEEQLAGEAEVYTPHELNEWGSALVALLDQDGEAPDDQPPVQVNELFLSRLPGGGGKLRGRFDDAAMFDAIATVLDAHAKPLTGADDRSAGARQTEVHIVPWEHGGETTLSNLVMLCAAHHRQIHFTEWVVRIRDGLPEFIPPKWLDVEQRPRRRALPHLAAAE